MNSKHLYKPRTCLKIGPECSRNLEKVINRIALFCKMNKGWVVEE